MADGLTENGKALVRDMPQVVNMLAEELIERFEESMLYGEKPRTNYDRIVSKTPEELAEWLAYSPMPKEVRKGMNNGAFESQADAFLWWLKQEASDAKD